MRLRPMHENTFRVATTRQGDMFSEETFAKHPKPVLDRSMAEKQQLMEQANRTVMRRMEYTNCLHQNSKLQKSLYDGSMAL